MDKQIRFIDSSYNELFTIPDRGIIAVKYPDGHTENKFCLLYRIYYLQEH